MDKADIEYTIKLLDIIKDNARLGVDSKNNMEQVIFRTIYDDTLTLRNSFATKLRIFAKTTDSGGER